MESISLYIALTVVTLYLLNFLWRHLISSNHVTRPKSPSLPPCLPFIKTLSFLLRPPILHLFFTDMARKYGKIFSLRAGNVYIVVLNGHEAIREGLVKQALAFAGRINFYSDIQVINPDIKGITFRQYDNKFKFNHQISLSILKQFGYGNITEMENMIQIEISELDKTLTSSRGVEFCPFDVLQLTSLNIIANFLFGERYPSTDDSTFRFIIDLNTTTISSHDLTLDVLPVTRYFPSTRRMLRDLAKVKNDMIDFYATKIRQCLDATAGRRNFVQEFHDKAGDDFDENELVYILRDIIIAGMETSADVIAWALILIGNTPDVQKRLQREIDSVIPRDRYPTLEDKAKLPYLEAMIHEVLRIKTVAPLALPHRVSKDVELCGYRIPENTMVFVNLYSAHMDENVWPNPEKFSPERFLDDNGQLTNKNLMLAFSIGKRACFGEMLARQELFLILATICQRFDILPPTGEDKINFDTFARTIQRPANFQVRFVSREGVTEEKANRVRESG